MPNPFPHLAGIHLPAGNSAINIILQTDWNSCILTKVQSAGNVLCARYGLWVFRAPPTPTVTGLKDTEKSNPSNWGRIAGWTSCLPAWLPPASVCVAWSGRKTLKIFPNSLVKVRLYSNLFGLLSSRKWIHKRECEFQTHFSGSSAAIYSSSGLEVGIAQRKQAVYAISDYKPQTCTQIEFGIASLVSATRYRVQISCYSWNDLSTLFLCMKRAVNSVEKPECYMYTEGQVIPNGICHADGVRTCESVLTVHPHRLHWLEEETTVTQLSCLHTYCGHMYLTPEENALTEEARWKWSPPPFIDHNKLLLFAKIYCMFPGWSLPLNTRSSVVIAVVMYKACTYT